MSNYGTVTAKLTANNSNIFSPLMLYLQISGAWSRQQKTFKLSQSRTLGGKLGVLFAHHYLASQVLTKLCLAL